MKSTTTFFLYQTVRIRLHLLVILACVGVALLGHMPDSSAGWVTGKGTAYGITTGHRRCSKQQTTVGWHHDRRSVRVALLRSVLLGFLWYGSGKQWPMWLVYLPWATWGWKVLGLYWPWMRKQTEWRALLWLGREVERLVLILALCWPLRMGLRKLMLGQLSFPCDWPAMNTSWGLGACVVCKSKTPSVSVVADENNGYTAKLNGNFTLRVAGDDPFRKHLLILFLRLLEVPGQTRGSRRTRDGRTPFVRQQDLETAFGVPQPNISRWERYWLEGDWRRLLSLHTAEVLTLELQAQIVHVFAQFPWWGVEKVYQHLQEQDVTVSHRQVRQAAEESGWSLLRKELRKRYHLTAESFYPRDDWLVSQLLAQVQALLKKLETGNGLTPQEQTKIIDLQTLSDEIGVAETSPPLKTLPLLLRLERVLFGSWERVTEEQVRCIYCNSTQVARKSRKPRIKRYYDNEGNERTIEVFRYYCHNPNCEKKTFTNLPPDLVPHSPYRMETHLLAIQMYA